MCVVRCVRPEAYMTFVCCYKEIEYERALWDFFQSYCGRDVPEVCLPLVLVRHLFHLVYLIDALDFWCRDCAFECRLHRHGVC